MLSFRNKIDNLRIFQIEGYVNAAIARNVGIKQSHYKYICFLDGDVEICSEFVSSALLEMVNSSEIGCVLGQLEELQYSTDQKRIVRVVKDRNNIKERGLQAKLSGGIFLAKRSIVQVLMGFDDRFGIKEDYDFSVRLMSRSKILSLPKKMGIHHTIPYRSLERTKKILFSSYNFYLGMLLRKHIIYPRRIWFIVKTEYGLFLGLLFWFLLVLSILTPYIFAKLLFGFFLIGDLFLGLRKDRKNLFGRFISHYIFSIQALFGFLFWFPKQKESWKTSVKERLG